MSTELLYLTYTATLTLIIWIPYILNFISVQGLSNAVGYPDELKPMAPWAQRLKAAHYNAVENLVVFAALVLVANAVDLSNAATQTACMVYFWARVVHCIVYTFAIPWLRTLSFAVSWAAMVCIAWQLLTL